MSEVDDLLDNLLTKADELTRQIRDVERVAEALARERRVWLQMAVDVAGVEVVARRLFMTRGHLVRILNGNWG